MRKLAFLIILSELFFLSCNDHDVDPTTLEVKVLNESGVGLSLHLFQTSNGELVQQITIPNDVSFEGDTIFFENETWLNFRDFILGDSAIIRFSGGRELTYVCKLPNGEGCQEERNLYFDYSIEITDRIRNIYTFTPEDYERAE